jgi:uncharacterized protein YdaU (DUF1376 family)
MRNKEDKPLWMPMYWQSYFSKTRHLTTKQHGAYILLIGEYWIRGKLPADERRLARIAGLTSSEWRAERSILSEFFEDGWKHSRIEEELEIARQIIIRQRNNALSGWSKRRAQGTIVKFPKKTEHNQEEE